MPARFTFKVHCVAQCTKCDATFASQLYTVHRRDEIPCPNEPEGWQVFNGQLLCPKHEVYVDIRNKEYCPPKSSDPGYERVWYDPEVPLKEAEKVAQEVDKVVGQMAEKLLKKLRDGGYLVWR